MVVEPPKPPEWEREFDTVIERMRQSFLENKIQEFLMNHLRVNQLFTNKLQWVIDNKEGIIKEYKIDFNANAMKTLEDLNQNIKTMLGAKDDTKLIPADNQPSIQGASDKKA